jgi:hypothetical protein
MRQPNTEDFKKKPSDGASNNGRIDGASVCVCVCVCERVRACAQEIYIEGDYVSKRCRMSYYYTAVRSYRELFDCPSYTFFSKEYEAQLNKMTA